MPEGSARDAIRFSIFIPVHNGGRWLGGASSGATTAPRRSPPWNFGSAAIARDVLEELGRYVRDDDPIMSTDLELAFTVAAIGSVIYIDGPLLDVSAWP